MRHAVAHILATCAPAQRAAIIGIGIGVVGPFSVRSRRFLSPPSFGAWQNLALGERISGEFGIPTYVDNNGNTSALAELWFGAGQGVDHFVLLSIGAGVGAGLVLDGDLYRGDHDLAGELGHISVNADGPRCVCGNYGCLEMYVAVPRILEAVTRALAAGTPSSLHLRMHSGERITLDHVLDAARANDALAARVLAETTRMLAVGIVNIIHSFDPRLVLIARGLGAAGDFVLDPVRAEVRHRVFPVLADLVRIEAAALPDAPVIGAATLALREFFHAPLVHADTLG